MIFFGHNLNGTVLPEGRLYGHMVKYYLATKYIFYDLFDPTYEKTGNPVCLHFFVYTSKPMSSAKVRPTFRTYFF